MFTINRLFVHLHRILNVSTTHRTLRFLSLPTHEKTKQKCHYRLSGRNYHRYYLRIESLICDAADEERCRHRVHTFLPLRFRSAALRPVPAVPQTEFPGFRKANRRIVHPRTALHLQQHLSFRCIRIHRFRTGYYAGIPLPRPSGHHHGISESRTFMAGMACHCRHLRRCAHHDTK